MSSGKLLPGAVWITGISAAGKSTTARALYQELVNQGYENVEILDGEELRSRLDRVYGFTPEERFEVIKNVVRVAREFVEQGKLVIVAVISHQIKAREYAREKLGRFTEVYLRCSADVCAARDYKGHYELAKKGEYDCFIGVTDAYEEYDRAEYVFDTASVSTAEIVSELVSYVKEQSAAQNNVERVPPAIIVAAGRGSRLGELTKDKPKCLVPIAGKSLVQRQVEVLKSCGVSQISIIKGYQGEKIAVEGTNEFWNLQWARNNILNSLMCAKSAMFGGFIASYSDIIYSPRILEALVAAQGDICCVVDVDWIRSYENRTLHPCSEAEKVVIDSESHVLQVGKALPDSAQVSGEFIGMIRCSPRGAATFITAFEELVATHNGGPFMRAESFAQAYLTDFLQHLVNSGVTVHAVKVSGGWREIDTEEDIILAEQAFARGEFGLLS